MIRKLLDATTSLGEVNFGLLIFRFAIGGMMLTHGIPKLLRLFEGNLKFGNPLGIGSELSFLLVILAEFVGSLMLIVGFGTRIGALLMGFAMAVAGFIAHFEDPFGRKEKALLYLAACFLIWITGPGRYSLDYRFFSQKK